jgi:two-component system chemotaxis response regulator CheB
MPAVSGHRPSVDVLFHSAAQVAGSSAVGVILTGMGKDGADGLLAMRKAGAATLGQDEDSSLIYGMPRVAFERGAVARQFPLTHMADAILDACESGASGAPRGQHSTDAA